RGGQAADPPRRPARGGDLVRRAAAARQGTARRARRYGGDHRHHAGARGRVRARPAREPLMAQLTDDCFAFAGPLLPIAEMERLIAARITPVTEIEEVGLRAALGPALPRHILAPPH